jgi:hypothetical protein
MSGVEESKPKSDLDLESFIIQTLQKKGELTTRELRDQVRDHNLKCPDEPVRFFNRLRMRGILNGRISTEHRGWVWWVDQDKKK